MKEKLYFAIPDGLPSAKAHIFSRDDRRTRPEAQWVECDCGNPSCPIAWAKRHRPTLVWCGLPGHLLNCKCQSFGNQGEGGAR